MMIMNHIETNKGANVIAAVCDSYDYLATVDAVTKNEFKIKIESDDYPKFVIRPDSGDPIEMVNATLDIMVENDVARYTNKKGYIVFKKYGIIWGDGIDNIVIDDLLNLLKERGFAASNIAFGSGGWLMQQHDRDTQGWAVKCSQITLEGGIKRDVFKDPITAPNKKSKKGEITLWLNKVTDEWFTDTVDYADNNDSAVQDMLQTVYNTGKTS